MATLIGNLHQKPYRPQAGATARPLARMHMTIRVGLGDYGNAATVEQLGAGASSEAGLRADTKQRPCVWRAPRLVPVIQLHRDLWFEIEGRITTRRCRCCT